MRIVNLALINDPLSPILDEEDHQRVDIQYLSPEAQIPYPYENDNLTLRLSCGRLCLIKGEPFASAGDYMPFR